MSAVQTSFGRVDDNGTVYLSDNGIERAIGSQPTMSHEEALNFYIKRFEDMAATVRLLEQRTKAKADPKSINKSATKLLADLENANVVGDVESLRQKLRLIIEQLSVAVAELEEVRKLETEKAIADREAIAEAAEAIANTDAKKINYKQASAKMLELFNQWQALQKGNARVPKSKADLIWKRFSQARNTFESNKRAYFASQDQLAKASKGAKSDLAAKAEALVEKGADASVEYRELLNQWKKLPKVKSKSDDALWERFKAAGDAIYAAKSEKMKADDIEFAANLEAKLALLVEAEAIEVEKDLEKAKAALKSIQARWEKAGKVPRDSIRKIEDRLKAVEQKIKSFEQELWRKSDPTTIDRTNSLRTQLEQAIAKLEEEVKAAESKGDSKAASKAKEALEAKQSWLKVVLEA
ncbi:MAG: DUF349 domain-containing protein [Microbacteriaceae bacterium]|nr:DUF349 domain-containing protein [Microbacteriaceae bacterium]